MKLRTIFIAALTAIATLTCLQVRADNMATIAIAPATGEVTLVPRWATGANLSGFHHMAQDLSLGGGANQFYSIKGTPIPPGGDISAFTRYIAASGSATNHSDIGSKLTPNSYSALTSADPDLGYGSVQFYFIHHKDDGDYFSHIVPSSGTASAVTDLKPMSQPGGPSTGGESGYFGLTFAAANLGYGSNIFYYLREDTVTGVTKFGTLIPSLAGASADQFDLGTGGHNSLVYTGDDVGYGSAKMYFLRLDPITGYTILGTLDPLSGRYDDISNLGSVYSALTYVPGDLGFGIKQFYTTGSVNPGFQTVSFAAIDDRLIGAGSFTVAPSASSGLPVTLTVVSGSTGAASITGPIAGVYTVTPTAPGVITLQATQAGQLAPVVYEYNMLRQSFTATGATLLQITSQPVSQTKVAGSTATFSVSAIGSSTISYQWRKAGVNILGNASATTSTLTLPGVSSLDAASYDVVVTNLSGSIISDPATLTVTAAPPTITSPTTAGGTTGTAFNYAITASGSPITYSAAPLPAGLAINTATGAITGIPTTAGVTNVLLGATNATGTGNATLTITVAAAAVAPTITSPTTAGGTTGTAFNYTITASGSPTSFSAAPLPAGLAINTATGAITGIPTTAGVTNVLLGATNATGTGNATLTITVATAPVAPTITSPTTAGGTTGTAFNYTITASGSPISFSAAPLPAGLVLNPVTGAITGIPTTAGVTNVLLGATNATGTGNATLTITVATAPVAPTITSPTTAGGTTGTAFNYAITASGSPTSFSAAPLPAGLVVNTVTGAITGIPTTAGVTNVLLGATNATGTGNATLTITVAAAGVAPIITSPTTAGGTTGTAFNYTITASGSPTSFSASPLPAGLVVNTVTGAITGIPTTAGVTNVLLGATNATGTGNATLTITVAAAGVAPVITNNPLTAGGTTGTPFSFTITASGNPTSYSAAPLPAGLSINTVTGNISGTPTTAGTTSVLIGATNSTGTGFAALKITIAEAGVAPVITNDPLTAGGTTGTPFSFTITASGNPTSYSATPLPAGLSINTVTGNITGTPTTAGTTSVLLGATNSTGTGNATLTITIAAAGVAPVITNNPLTAGGTTGTPFSFTITASGNPTSYGASPLPAGLGINTVTGNISGTPTTAGTTSVLISATNATGTGFAALKITIAEAGVAPVITNDPLTAGGTTGTAFSFTITASGNPTSYSASPLPAGLSINTVTGNISGTPTEAGTTSVLLGATNETGTGNATLTITIAAAGVAPVITNNPLTAGGTTGTPFSFTITASGNPTSYGASPLPAGLGINTVTGNISGTPTTAGTTSVLISATNATGTGFAALNITISEAGVAPVITNDPLTAGGTTGTAFSFTITASGDPTSYSAEPLPAGLGIDTVTGEISGTPTEAGTTEVLLGATNETGTGNATLTITIAAAGVAPVITNDPLTAGGTTGTAFSFTITASGTPTSYSAEPLPVGLIIDTETGEISGIPTETGTTSVLIGATNSTGTGSALLTITVSPAPVAPVITSPLTADGTLRLPFSYTITASGLPTSYSSSALPAGLTLDPDTGVISGIPTIKAVTSVTIRATNVAGTGTAILRINVSDVIRVTIRGPLGTVIYLTPGGALPPAGTTYSIKGLPSGFVLDPVTGRVTTPSVVTAKPGIYRVTYVAITTDSEGNVTRGPATTFIITVDALLPEMSGGFEAILDDSPESGLPIGKVAIVVNRQTGAYTGSLIHATSPKVYTFKGLLTLDGSYEAGTGSMTISRGALNPLRINLAFDTNAEAGQVFVASLDQLDATGTFVATLGRSETGTQLATFTKASPAAWRGNYTLALDDPEFPPLNLGTEIAPEGTGSGLARIDSVRGRMVFKGKLGDGAPLSASLAPGADGSYRWFVKPYKTGGYFGGRIRYTLVAGTTSRYQVTGPVGSELYWAKNPAPATSNHRDGFGPIAITATSERWLVPTTRDALRVALGLEQNSVMVSFTSAGLPEAQVDGLPATQALDAKNLVLLSDATADMAYARGRKVAGNFRPNGLFTATFTLPDSRKVSVSGALLQHPSVVAGTVIGEGYFTVPPIVRGDEQVQGQIQFIAP